jgi:cholesterol oxidase
MPDKIGLSFNEVMFGGFAMGSTDPLAGEKLGNAQSSILVMNADIAIDDLDRFLQDPQHVGNLSGTIDFTPIGQGLISTTGVFKLFSPGNAPGEKWMVYELGFSGNGKPYYLAGKKIVPRRSGPKLLPETTTLYTTLHAGSDTTGVVVAAGTLHLGPTELSNLLKTIHTSNATNTFESFQAVTKFLKFFLGELWHSFL